MPRNIRTLLLPLLLILTSFVFAQNPPQQFTFDGSGITVTIPEGGLLNVTGDIPAVTISDMLIQMIEPEVIGVTAEDTVDAPLDGVLDYLLGLVGFDGQRADDQTFTLTLDDGRDAIVFDFINSSGNAQSVMVFRLSNRQTAALNIRAAEALTGPQQNTVLEIAASFDSPAEAAEPEAPVDPVAALTAGLTESHTFASGTSFSYPPEYTLGDSAGQSVQVAVNNEISIIMIDPAALGVPAGEPLEDVIEFAIDGTEIAAEDFEPFDVGGREAVIANGASGQFTQTMALVRFDDGTVGILDILSVDSLKGDRLAEVQGIAASFNSATDAASAPSRADIEQAKALFEEAMETRDSGDLEASLPLFNESLTLNDSDPLVLYWRGNTLKETGDIEAAIADLERAKSLDPEVVPIRTALAEVYVLADDLETALEELEFVADLQGSSASEGLLGEIEMYRGILAGEFIRGFYVNRAERYTKFGLYERAIQDIEDIIAVEPSNWEWRARLGNIYAAADQHREAIGAYTDALELDTRGIVFYNRAAAYQDAFATAIGTIPDALLQTDYNYRCSLLVPDPLMTEELQASAQSRLVTIIISDDDYTPVTDPADCVP